MADQIWNQLIIVGNLGQDPDVRFFETGSCVCSFNIAVWQGKDKPTTWLPVTLWKDAAEKAADLRKGDKVRLTGKLDHDEWTDKATGQKRTKLKMTAFEFEVFKKLDREAWVDKNLDAYEDSLSIF